ncbi:MAG TPA: sulfatase [Actinomycetota bacterium]
MGVVGQLQRAARARGRSLVRVVLAGAIAVSGVVAVAPSASAVGPRRPDIVVIVTDDQHRSTLGWLPTVRREIADRGVVFTHAMVPTSVCCPSRATLFTGLYAHSTKVWSNSQGWQRFRNAGMESRTIAVWLRRAGYRTGLVGKYLNSYLGSQPPPGWRVWHAFRGTNAAYYGYELVHTDGSISRHGYGPAEYSTDVLRRHAVSFLRRSSDRRPTFLYFAPYAPHGPSTPAPRHVNLPVRIDPFGPPSVNEADVSDKPSWIRRLPLVDTSAIQSMRRQEYRSLRAVDEAVAAIIDVQRDRGRIRNTLMFVLADNGEMWGEHRAQGKFLPYAGATRIPMALAWPARVPAGRRDRRLTLNVDVAATIAAAAEAAHDPIEGRNLLRRGWSRRGFVLEAEGTDALGGNGTNVTRPAYCGWRTRRFLYVRYGNGREELYDYAEDRWELTDVHGRALYRDRKATFRRRARARCDPPPPGFTWR